MAKNNVREARELAVKLVFQMDATNNFKHEELIANDMTENYKEFPRTVEILENIKEHIVDIDEKISKSSKNRDVKRIAKGDLAIIRVALCEIMYLDDVPEAVAINEAVELSKKYGTDKAPSFVNALLGNIVRSE